MKLRGKEKERWKKGGERFFSFLSHFLEGVKARKQGETSRVTHHGGGGGGIGGGVGRHVLLAVIPNYHKFK